jgi:hypothetical protein
MSVLCITHIPLMPSVIYFMVTYYCRSIANRADPAATVIPGIYCQLGCVPEIHALASPKCSEKWPYPCKPGHARCGISL